MFYLFIFTLYWLAESYPSIQLYPLRGIPALQKKYTTTTIKVLTKLTLLSPTSALPSLVLASEAQSFLLQDTGHKAQGTHWRWMPINAWDDPHIPGANGRADMTYFVAARYSGSGTNWLNKRYLHWFKNKSLNRHYKVIMNAVGLKNAWNSALSKLYCILK